MKKLNFLDKLRKEGKLGFAEPSEELCLSYLEKAENCLKSARLLLQSNLYENSIINSYYTMYNSLLALLFKVGIKSENHTASILLLEKLFNRTDLFGIISSAKGERIDKQYYVSSKQNLIATDISTKDMLIKAEDFSIKIRLFIKNSNKIDIEKIRQKFKSFF
ncbi:MAG: HEPN domain-containing protein [Candidatus Pacearchaeota archaeon]|nr:HEPN domain-containing protein [Candidatus Pacearchaeota archaeon]